MKDVRVLAEGLEFPEGPVALPDGDVIVTELRTGRLIRVKPDGTKEVAAEVGGSANGCAIGPDGAAYVTNSGGFNFMDVGFLVPQNEHHETQPPDYVGGRIQRVDLATGEVTDLYTECDGNQLRGPNDLVFDETGGFWFTDHGKVRRREEDRGGLYYAAADGSSIREVVYPLSGPNGVGLSPDGTELYVAETHSGRVWGWSLSGPGQLGATEGGFGPGGARLLVGLEGYQLLDSLAVDAEGNVVVATIISAGFTSITPGGKATLHPLPAELFDPLPTNIAFGGPDLRTAYLTSSGTRRLLTCTWGTAGAPLWFLNKQP